MITAAKNEMTKVMSSLPKRRLDLDPIVQTATLQMQFAAITIYRALQFRQAVSTPGVNAADFLKDERPEYRILRKGLSPSQTNR
jgi:hypothetical protein